MKPPGKNIAESARARLLNLAKQRGEEFHLTLAEYAVERFLYRLGQSPLRDRFVPKGAVLFRVWMGQTHRPTKDLDLLGKGSSDLSAVAGAIREVCLVESLDGLVFDLPGMHAERIREGAEYEGVRIRLRAELASARIPLQIDVGFGDQVTPPPSVTAVPSMLGMDVPRVLAYPRETVVAEKLHAMVILDISNTRMKDFYDVWFLSQNCPFDLLALAGAIRATFQRRGTALPSETPMALTPAFHSDEQKSLQWKAFVKRLRLDSSTPGLDEIGEAIKRFVDAPLAEARNQNVCREDLVGFQRVGHAYFLGCVTIIPSVLHGDAQPLDAGGAASGTARFVPAALSRFGRTLSYPAEFPLPAIPAPVSASPLTINLRP